MPTEAAAARVSGSNNVLEGDLLPLLGGEKIMLLLKKSLADSAVVASGKKNRVSAWTRSRRWWYFNKATDNDAVAVGGAESNVASGVYSVVGSSGGKRRPYKNGCGGNRYKLPVASLSGQRHHNSQR
jgi:hypothetical protein